MRDMRVVAVASFSLLIGVATCANAQTDTCFRGSVMQVSMPLGLMSQRIAFTGVVKTSFEQKLVEELKLGEPDASLFAAPADYKVQEMNSGGIAGGVMLGTAISGVSGQ